MEIVFSGLHGSGKTTLLEHALNSLRKKGYKARRVNVVELSLFELLKRGFGFEKKKKTSIMEKDYSSTFYSIIRSFLFVFDIIIFYIFRLFIKKDEIIVYDRYFYDKLANFNTKNWFFKSYCAVYKLFIPNIDTIFHVYVSAEKAYKRKPEYNKDFFAKLFESYNWLFKNVKNVHVVKNDNLAVSKKSIENVLKDKLALFSK